MGKQSAEQAKAERGAPERRRPQSKPSERDLQPPPAWNRVEYRLFLDADGALGCVLWQRARDVRLWAAFQPAPLGLFRAPTPLQQTLHQTAITEAPGVADSLCVLLGMVCRPAETARAEVARACIQISQWGNDGNCVEVALAYAEAAALADPTSAEAAAVAGMLCLRVTPEPGGEPMDVRAAAWLRRAARLARRAKDWEWYIRAHIRLGLLLYRLGDYSAARKMYERAGWMADWFGRDELAGKAHHDLVAIESFVGTYSAAAGETRKALALYPLRHDRIPYLIHDFAFALMRHAYYSASLKLLEAVWDHIPEPNRLIINGTVARVTAGLRDRIRYESAATHVALLAEICADGASWAYIHIAEGARCFEEWDRAESYAGHALDLAIQLREIDAQRAAYEVLDTVMLRVPAAREQPAPASVDELVSMCLDRLARLREPDEAAVPAAQVVTTAWAP
jgi:tetratricopeptide (TPR) repeat protein